MELKIIISYACAASKSHAPDYQRKIDCYTYDGKEWALMVMTCSGAQLSSTRCHMKNVIRNSAFLKGLLTGTPRLPQFSQKDDEHISYQFCCWFFLQFFQLKVLLEPFIYLESIQSLLDVWNILYVITFMWKFTHEKPKVSDRYWLIFC